MTREGSSKSDRPVVASPQDKVNLDKVNLGKVNIGKVNAGKDRGARTLAALVAPEMATVLRARGFANAALHEHWMEIVGARLAAFSMAERLKWPPRPQRDDASDARQPATLVVRVEPAFALELSHQTGLILDRANAFLGWRCVEKVVLSQGPVRALKASTRPAPRALTPQEQAALKTATADIKDDDIRKALMRLGAGILRDQQVKK